MKWLFQITFQGNWRFFRNLLDRTTSTSLGTVKGHVTFTSIEANIVHYLEDGEYTTASGETTHTSREYLYQYDSENDEISKHYSRDRTDHGLFYRLRFQDSAIISSKSIITAQGDHLCSKDQYNATYQFIINKDRKLLNKFRLQYDVTGPHKNYISDTTFEKQKSDSLISSKPMLYSIGITSPENIFLQK